VVERDNGMKTKPMAHQLDALARMAGRESYALFMEQGTGKTWTLLADAERLYAAGRIDGVLVIAPKGVHLNWVNREIPTHLDAPIVAAAWRSGTQNRKQLAALDRLFEPRAEGEIPLLRVLSMNIEALITRDGYDMARRFLNAVRAMIIVDESSRIKSPDARRTKVAMQLRPSAAFARIATGTPITNSPVDVFAQMEFLESGLLGTTSYRAFVAEYAELVPNGHPLMRQLAQRNPRAANAQIIARNPDGSPRWRNLDRLQKLLEPHSFRVLKRDCLDLPEKIYKTHFFELSAAQSRAYRSMRDDLRMELMDGAMATVTQLGSMVKLQQITSGFAIPPGGGEPLYISKDNPRLAALLGLLEDIEGSVIIWARFREELSQIAELLRAAKIDFVEYHGGIPQAARELAVDAFQSRAAQVFLGQPQSGGIGLTLTAAETVIYFSNDFNLETRLQSEDRAHRIGTRSNVLYIDIVAEGTIDESIAAALQRKTDVAAAILGDLRSGEGER
jgi:SNF2 family DNA or RNA helicase